MSRTQRLGAILGVLVASTGIFAATITTGEPSASSDGLTELPILFQPGPGQSVSGLQFEITFDPAQLSIENIVAGAISTQADKMVSFNRLNKGRCRVIIAGFNQNVFAQGALATLHIRPAVPGLRIALENPIMSDPRGQAVQGSAKGIQMPEAGTPAPAASARPACACAPQPGADYRGDALLLLGVAAMLSARRARGGAGRAP